ncbi:hypothetical protein BC628DRAFT_1405786 [Trametes gibbosa]|nr:hypothetical protein BC628DRAFT_1405786 [Trametes gibbosa]
MRAYQRRRACPRSVPGTGQGMRRFEQNRLCTQRGERSPRRGASRAVGRPPQCLARSVRRTASAASRARLTPRAGSRARLSFAVSRWAAPGLPALRAAAGSARGRRRRQGVVHGRRPRARARTCAVAGAKSCWGVRRLSTLLTLSTLSTRRGRGCAVYWRTLGLP